MQNSIRRAHLAGVLTGVAPVLLSLTLCALIAATSPVAAQTPPAADAAKTDVKGADAKSGDAKSGDAKSADAKSGSGDVAASLREKQQALAPALAHNAFGAPIVLESTERDGALTGDVYALVAHPFTEVAGALKTPSQWCDVLILHLNVKSCAAKGAGVELNVGSKHDQPDGGGYKLLLAHKVIAANPETLQVAMNADSGPLGTRDYRIALEAIPADAGHTFMHFRYGYAYGISARVAMQAYLNTAGRSRIGFSTVNDASGKPAPVGGMRGALERNAMRYYLAIEAYLDHPGADKANVDKRLAAWFDSTERYAKALHELDRDEYLSMKANEVKSRAQPG